MILLEAVWFVLKRVLRFLVWFITARDCRHCKYGYTKSVGRWFCSNSSAHPCDETICRCDFERR